jgi:hypothetical protein
MALGISLHVAVNRCDPDHYSGWSGPLFACENDADDMYKLAIAQNFDATILKTEEATRPAVKKSIEDAATKLKPGDFFLLTYSGHGGQLKDYDGDEKDGKDETWCLYDGQLLDDELNIFWSMFARGVRILLLSDSCHSGSVSKGGSGDSGEDPYAGEICRDMPRNAAVATSKKNREFYANLQLGLPDPRPPIEASVRLISGCQDHQKSSEGDGNGRFTRALTTVWSGGEYSGSYSELHKEICAALPEKQQPNHMVVGMSDDAYDGQRPFTI